VFVTPLVGWCFYCPSSQSCQVIDVAQTEGIKPKRKERERERTLILHRYHVGYTRIRQWLVAQPRTKTFCCSTRKNGTRSSHGPAIIMTVPSHPLLRPLQRLNGFTLRQVVITNTKLPPPASQPAKRLTFLGGFSVPAWRLYLIKKEQRAAERVRWHLHDGRRAMCVRVGDPSSGTRHYI
jgi:hypothetical protein